MRIGPVTFLCLVVGSWVLLRALMLWPDRIAQHNAPRIAWQPALIAAAATPNPFGLSLSKPSVLDASVSRKGGLRQAQSERVFENSPAPDNPLSSADKENSAAASVATSPVPAAPQAEPPPRKLTISAWSIVRGDASPTLAAGGQLGGSQVGVRARYPIGPALHLAARLSAPLGSSRGKEAAVAVDWRPVPALPVTLTAERRIGLDRGGRDAFAVGAFGGFDRVLPSGARIDGYGQAGIVGARRRDAYIDGSIRADAPVAAIGRARIAAGAGAWGGAQPRVSRLDIGPQIVVRAHRLRLGAEWRHRVSGSARPGSGPALSLGADF